MNIGCVIEMDPHFLELVLAHGDSSSTPNLSRGVEAHLIICFGSAGVRRSLTSQISQGFSQRDV